MSPLPISSRTRLGAAAGLLGVAAALTAVTGVGPVPSVFQLTGASEDIRGNCDELEHAGDPACAGTLTARGSDDDSSDSSGTSDDASTSSTSSTSTTAGGAADIRTVSAGDAGSIMVAVDGTGLQLLAATPNPGWQVDVEHASGHEVEVTFRSGTLRVDVDVELEDGQVRERVRTRDDATDTETRVENGVVVRDDASEIDDDADHGTDGSDELDDSSGPGSGSDDVADDTSGHGSDDGPNHD